MRTPISDFVSQYRNSGASRFHMPGHKGKPFLGAEPWDITEIDEAKNAYKILGGKLAEVREYELPENYGCRVLAVVEKVKNTPAKYPRGQGKERKNPL